MRKFVLKLLLFASPVLIAAIAMEPILRYLPNDYKCKKEYLDKNSERIETLILGSSHSFYGINPEFFSTNAFNASHVSQTLNFDFEIFRTYENNFKNLKTIIIPISYPTLWEKLELSIESWRVKNYVLYYGMKTSNSFRDFSEVLDIEPQYNLRRLVSYYVKGRSDITCSELGWGTNYRSENAHNLVETGKIAVERHTIKNINSEENQNIFNENLDVLKTIIQWGIEHKAYVILFTPPAFETYSENLDSGQLDATIKTASNLASEYENCIYLNLLADTTFVASDFYDADHLSEIGAKKLSTLLNYKQKQTKDKLATMHLLTNF